MLTCAPQVQFKILLLMHFVFCQNILIKYKNLLTNITLYSVFPPCWFCEVIFFSLSLSLDHGIIFPVLKFNLPESMVSLACMPFNPFTPRAKPWVNKCGCTFYICGWNPSVWPFKWKLLSSTFMFLVFQYKLWNLRFVFQFWTLALLGVEGLTTWASFSTMTSASDAD